MFDSHVLTFTGVALAVTLLPGADTMLVIRNVLARGQHAGVITTIGICSGVFVHATLSACGLSLILLQSAQVFEFVKIIGACYLVFLGIQSFRQIHTTQMLVVTQGTTSVSHPQRHISWWRSAGEGFASNVLNPKVAIFYLAFLPQFIEPSDPVLAKSLLLAGIHFTLASIWLTSIVFFLGKIGAFLERPTIQAKLQAITGIILIALGVRLALEHR